jgi:hypothetical protein
VILGAELVRHYKPDREVYQSAADILDVPPSSVMMVAAHLGDLRAAKGVGLKTAFVTRPMEFGPNGKTRPGGGLIRGRQREGLQRPGDAARSVTSNRRIQRVGEMVIEITNHHSCIHHCGRQCNVTRSDSKPSRTHPASSSVRSIIA